MIAGEQTRVILRELNQVGWTRKRSGKGSHSVWHCATGRHKITVPDGHRTIRPGVVRSIRDAVTNCNCHQ